MEMLSDAEWDDFDRFVETLGPLYVAEEEIVFRGEATPITIEYVRSPSLDARKIAGVLEKKPDMFEDAGFLTILPFAKSIEMHLRLLYFGTEREAFGNNQFKSSAALSSIAKWMNSEQEQNPSHKGIQGKPIEADGEFFQRFQENHRQVRGKVWQLIKIARKVYEKGHEYRHNQIQDWSEIRPLYIEQSALFEEFCGLFDRLTR